MEHRVGLLSEHLIQVVGIRDIALNVIGCRIHILTRTRCFVVDDNHRVPFPDKAIHQMASNEPRTPCYQNPLPLHRMSSSL